MLALALLSLAAVQSLSTEVIVVDPLGGGDFLAIQDAVDAAQAGDVLLVSFALGLPQAGFDVVGKPLVITSAEPGALVPIHGSILVADLPAGKEVVLSGFDVTPIVGPDMQQNIALRIEDCLGSVRVENCALQGANNLFEPPNCSGFFNDQGFDGCHVKGSPNVALVSTQVRGGQGVVQYYKTSVEGCGFEEPGGDGGIGLDASASSLALFDCSVSGGAAGQGFWGGNGGIGLRAIGGTLVFSGGAIIGGDGGLGIYWAGGHGGDGGAGLLAGATTYLLGGFFLGGAGGESFSSYAGTPGDAILGTPTLWPGTSRSLRIYSPATEGAALKLFFRGQASDYVLLFLSISQSFELFPAYQGVALIGTAKALSVGVCDAAGKLELQVPIPLLDPSYEAAVLAAQSVFVSTTAEIVAGPCGHAVLLDAAF